MLTTLEAAMQLGISKRGLLKLVERGTLPASRLGNQYVFTAGDVARAAKRPGRGRPAAKARG